MDKPMLTVKECVEKNISKLAATRYYDLTDFDYALPQPWVNECIEKGFNSVSSCVWDYTNNRFRKCFPLTQDAKDKLIEIGMI